MSSDSVANIDAKVQTAEVVKKHTVNFNVPKRTVKNWKLMYFDGKQVAYFHVTILAIHAIKAVC